MGMLGGWNEWMTDQRRYAAASVGLLLLRLGFGLMMMLGHGLSKLTGFAEKSGEFPDPLGVGNSLSMALAIFAEIGCSILIVLGLATRVAAIPLIITMVVAVFVIHGSDPWPKKEFAMLYLVPFLTLVFTGAGRFSLDAAIFCRCSRENQSL